MQFLRWLLPNLANVRDTIWGSLGWLVMGFIALRLYQRWRGARSKWEQKRIERKLQADDRFARLVISGIQSVRFREYIAQLAADARHLSTVLFVLAAFSLLSSQHSMLVSSAWYIYISLAFGFLTLVFGAASFWFAHRQFQILSAACLAHYDEVTGTLTYRGHTYALPTDESVEGLRTDVIAPTDALKD